KYALMHGQPVNSVLNGVLPIHIAASSGNDLVVQMLIDAGADVNAARYADHYHLLHNMPCRHFHTHYRLPRKYNADRSKAISSIGAAGSTPLHFAAANGHAHIVSLLLSHGANPDATEKHGLKPEDLAREAGHV
ncbi:ankyrin, partial [Cystobasidium minutum MCA 4210]|uniref:ankyrin n=1 Tax=Cystobasidium minutum MCA 4210 TaxID=1397322 RepID=UPI0034CFFC6E